MNIQLSITTSTIAALELAVASAVRSMPTFAPQLWTVTATVVAAAPLSPQEVAYLQQRMGTLPGVVLSVIGEDPDAQRERRRGELAAASGFDPDSSEVENMLSVWESEEE